MKKQEIYVEPYDWRIVVFYNASLDYMPMIAHELQRIGMNKEYIKQAYVNLRRPNTGLTYTNQDKRSSVAVISETTSASEFADTYDHEKGHIVRHISEANGLYPYSEEEQYLAGSISKTMFEYAKDYLCEHCRDEK